MSKRLTRTDLIAGKQYRMRDWYEKDGPLAEGTVVTVLNPTGLVRVGEKLSIGLKGIVVVVTAELEAANLLANLATTPPTEWEVAIGSLERLD